MDVDRNHLSRTRSRHDDGRARRGMSTVAALSEMLEHTDR
ncbi:hypothetical protein NY08_1601 [Rhodococcus sp. B7740]|nr:hypothetical protein NY08_1601 [Rhodococcus sp. B7740]